MWRAGDIFLFLFAKLDTVMKYTCAPYYYSANSVLARRMGFHRGSVIRICGNAPPGGRLSNRARMTDTESNEAGLE